MIDDGSADGFTGSDDHRGEAEAQQARGFDIFAFAVNVAQKILQPLLGIAFVVLYLDSTNRFER